MPNNSTLIVKILGAIQRTDVQGHWALCFEDIYQLRLASLTRM